MTGKAQWEEFAPDYFYDADNQPDLRPKADEQVPHLLVIESIDYADAHMSKLWVECPLNHRTGRHWCSEEVYVSFRRAFKLVGAIAYVNHRTHVDCWITADVENTGVLEMLGVSPALNSPWPDEFPQQPGTYFVSWGCEGHGDNFCSWLELTG